MSGTQVKVKVKDFGKKESKLFKNFRKTLTDHEKLQDEYVSNLDEIRETITKLEEKKVTMIASSKANANFIGNIKLFMGNNGAKLVATYPDAEENIETLNEEEVDSNLAVD